MPTLGKPEHLEQLRLPARSARVAANVDVLVVGGGPAGIGAAVGAARSGARTVLVERYGFLGGNATAALVMPLMSFHTQRAALESGAAKLYPDDHGPGDPVIAGVLQELVVRLVRAGGAIAPSLETGFVVPFDPEIFKIVCMELLDEAGVGYLFHSFASGIVGEGKVEGVVFESKSGPLVIRAKAIVDCTGDGDIAVAAGAPYEIGREEDGLVQPMTLMFRIVEFQQQAFSEYVRTHPGQWRGVHGLWDLVREASAKGDLRLEREDILFFATPHEEEVSVNSTRVLKVLGTDVWDLSYAEREGRRQLKQIMQFLKTYVPGFEEAYAAQSGVQVGVRETRRVLGEHVLTADELLGAVKFPDAVARGSYPVDIHNPTGKGTILKRLPEGEWYDIPLRALKPRNLENVLVAGRAISGTHEAHSSYRIMPIAMATGQAAGVCAAIAAATERPTATVEPEIVQEELTRQGAAMPTPGTGA